MKGNIEARIFHSRALSFYISECNSYTIHYTISWLNNASSVLPAFERERSFVHQLSFNDWSGWDNMKFARALPMLPHPSF